jgi:hypothetical protein
MGGVVKARAEPRQANTSATVDAQEDLSMMRRPKATV